jgi:hypothetical protein
MPSRCSSLRFSPAPEPDEPLALCLQALLGGYGLEVSLRELSCVLGTAFMVSRAPGAEVPARWDIFGRHAFLEPAARLYGLELRDLHPPSAAPPPPAPAEFAWHFRDSYLPFIELALARDEPVLAWVGWPGDAADSWGIITMPGGRGRHCRGIVPGYGSETVELADPPVQLYTIQSCAPRRPERVEAVRLCLAHAARVLANQLDPAYGVVTGPEALKAWGATLTKGRIDAGALRLLAGVAAKAAVGRRAAAAFLGECDSPASAADDVRAGLVQHLEEMWPLFASWSRPDKLSEALGGAAAGRKLRDDLSRLLDLEAAAAGRCAEAAAAIEAAPGSRSTRG